MLSEDMQRVKDYAHSEQFVLGREGGDYYSGFYVLRLQEHIDSLTAHVDKLRDGMLRAAQTLREAGLAGALCEELHELSSEPVRVQQDTE